MDLKEKIRTLREFHNWTQEQMAELMDISTNSYARLERGESQMKMEHLEKIAKLFKIDAIDLMKATDKSVLFLLSETENAFDSGNNQNNYYGNDTLIHEVDKLKLIIQHKDELLAQQKNEIELLKTLVSTLQNQK